MHLLGPVPTRLVAGLVAAVLVLAASLVEALTYRGAPPSSFVVPLVLLVIGAALAPLLPAAGLVVAVLAYPVQLLLDPGSPGVGGTTLIVMMVFVGLAGRRLRPRWSAPGAALTAVSGSGALVASGEQVFEFLFFAVTMGGAWLVGWLLRREARRSAELRELAAALAAERERSGRLAAVEERARISRELHDAVAHTVSVMTLQVGVLRRRLRDTAEGEALRAVEELGRRSVDELRRVVGALRDDHGPRDPAPSLSRLPALVDELGRVGLAVAVREEGEPVALAPAMDTSAYRIVAEALTNVLRHAGTAEAEVVITHGREALTIVVLDRGQGPECAGDPHPDPHGGHGLLHLRERAALFGGTLSAGPRDDGGYRVEAVLPLVAAARTTPAVVS